MRSPAIPSSPLGVSFAAMVVAMGLLARCALCGTSTPPARPHIVFILADDLGFYDTSIYNPVSPTPTLRKLAGEGIVLERHYVYRYCSPTRRSFFSGRFPNRITTVQPDDCSATAKNLCSDFLPLAVQTLPEKLAAAGGWETHYVGKGHEGYETTDHLPVNRGFTSHVGFLSGAEEYFHGVHGDACSGGAGSGTYDMWHNHGPGADVVDSIQYSANFYARSTVEIIKGRDKSKSLFLYLPYQNTHAPYELPPAWEVQAFPEMWDHTYANMIHMLDTAVKNVTEALVSEGLWGNTLLVFTADNGGIGKMGNNHPLRGHKLDSWDGGTRSTAFVAGGFVPAALRGTRSGAKLVHVADWYATFSVLAGVDPSNPVDFNGTIHDIDGVNVWPMLTGVNTTQPRLLTPTTEVGIIEATPERFWKLIVLAGQSVYYTQNNTQTAGTDPCLAASQPPPAQPGRGSSFVYGNGQGCPVCNISQPCLYDVLADPSETTNVAVQHPDVVARLLPPLAESNQQYVTGHLPAAVLAKDYVAVHPKEWGDFFGPCYTRKGAPTPPPIPPPPTPPPPPPLPPVPAGAFKGCFVDEVSKAPDTLTWDPKRDLPLNKGSDREMSPALCIAWCRKGNATRAAPFSFAGVQNGAFCLCGDSFGRYGPAPSSACNTPCPHDPRTMCGGHERHDVYATAVSVH